MNFGFLYLIAIGDLLGTQMCFHHIIGSLVSDAQVWMREWQSSGTPLPAVVSLHAHHLHLDSRAAAHHGRPWSQSPSHSHQDLFPFQWLTVYGSGRTGGQPTWGQDTNSATAEIQEPGRLPGSSLQTYYWWACEGVEEQCFTAWSSSFLPVCLESTEWIC